MIFLRQFHHAKLQEALSFMEWQIIDLLAEGLDNEEIAAALGMKKSTLTRYLSDLYRRLEIPDRGRHRQLTLLTWLTYPLFREGIRSLGEKR